MLSWSPTVKIFLGAEPTDMRKGFDSLAHLVESSMSLNPLSGHLFVFRSRRGDRIKVLYWDKDGYALWYKRLEKGSFRFPTAASTNGSKGLEVKAADLMMILDGVDLGSVRRQQRYSRETVEKPR
jgi:transposase